MQDLLNSVEVDMDFKEILDIVENFVIGLIIVIPVIAILIISFFIWNFFPQLLKSIPDFMVLILPMVIIVVSILLMGIVIYYIGKFLKKPFKSKVRLNSPNEVFCKNCGKKISDYADFCDSCGVKLQ